MCVVCDTIITVEHILIECAYLVEVRKKCFKERGFLFTVSACESRGTF